MQLYVHSMALHNLALSPQGALARKGEGGGIRNDYVRWLKRAETGRTCASPAAGSLAQFLGYRFSQAAGVSLRDPGRKYRRARLCDPSARTFNFSITAVYTDSAVIALFYLPAGRISYDMKAPGISS